MAATETWVLNGVALNSGAFTMLEVNVDPPKPRAEYMMAADSEGAALLREPQYENRTITMRLRVASQASFNAALDQLGAIRDQFRTASRTPAGLALVWTPANSTRTLTFDVLEGELTEIPVGLDGQAYSWFQQRPVFTVEMTCKPYGRHAEVTTSTASSATPFVTMELTSIPGDAPALGRLIVTDAATQNRRHVEWGLEPPETYNSGTSLLVDSDNMTVSGFAGTQSTATGAYDPNATGNSIVTATVFTQTATAICSTGNLSHVGTFRVKARVQAISAAAKVRLAWQANDGPIAANPWASPIALGRWEEIDLGVITIPAAVTGTGKWFGRVDVANSTSVGSQVNLDYLILVPAGEGYGKARAVAVTAAGAVVGYDDFTGTTAGNALNARVATAGGTWATSGAATDFVFSDDFATEQVSRVSVSDASRRFGILGATNYTDTQVRSGVGFTPAPTGVVQQGVIARWVDSSNYIRAFIDYGSSSTTAFAVEIVVAGVSTLINRPGTTLGPGNSYDIRLTVYATGRYIAEFFIGAALNPVQGIDGFDSRLATAGALATGKPGIVDINTGSGAVTRYYDRFTVATPLAEPIAIYSTRTMQIRWDDVIRVDSTNTYYGRPTSYRGTRFLVPPGTSRVLVKARRWDLETSEDVSVTDNTTIQVAYTPRSLVVPRT